MHQISHEEKGQKKSSHNDTHLPTLHLFSFPIKTHGAGSSHPPLRLSLFLHFDFLSNRGVDGKLEYFVDAMCLFAATLDVHGTHAFRNGLALFWRDRREALGFEEVDAGALVA